MKNPFAAALALALVPAALAQERVISDDGREVLLRDDGQWEFVSGDRFATTPGGDRVRLKADGSWEIVTGEDAAAVSPVATAQSLLEPGPITWSLDDVIIETARGKKSASKKNTSKQTNTVFNLRLRVSEDGPTTPWRLTAKDLRISDSGGREYPVLAISEQGGTLAPGERASTTVRVDGSPHWFTTSYYELRIAAAAAGSEEDIRLRRSLSTVLRRDVAEIPE